MTPADSPRTGPTPREDALAVWTAGVEAVEAGRLVRRALRVRGDALLLGGESVPLEPVRRILVVGAGKAGAPMAAAVEAVLGPRLLEAKRVEGRVNVPDRDVVPLRRVVLHPARSGYANQPTAAGVEGARLIRELLAGAGPRDLVLCLLSGGGSALLPAPVPGLTLADKRRVTGLLHASGAAIGEMNAVRKHLSALKGGGLARAAGRARVVSLIVSDVVADPLDVIASGPTAPDPTTYADALAVLDRRGLRGRTPPGVVAHLERGAAGELPETPKRLGPRVRNLVVGNNAAALRAAAAEGRRRGYRVVNLGSRVEGEAREVGRVLAGILASARAEGAPGAPPLCILSGGETTVTLGSRPGRGGRNQELVLAVLERLGEGGLAGAVVLSGGTDGEDGPTDAAGAVADAPTARRARRAGLDPAAALAAHDAYPFFDACGGLVKSGPTGTNVMDLRVAILRPTPPEAAGRGRGRASR